MVLENQNIAEPEVFAEIQHPVAIGPEHVLDFLRRHLGEAFDMGRGFNDDFMCADPVHSVIETEAFAPHFTLNLERGKLIGDDPDGPIRGVGSCRLWAIGHDFFRGQALLSRTKRAKRRGTRSSRLRGDEIMGAAAALR